MNRRLSIPSFSPPVPPQSEKARMWLSLGSEAWSVNSAFAIPDTSHSGLGAIKGGYAIENRLLPFSGRPVGDVITAGLSASLHGAFAHTGKLCRRGSAVALGTATAISPTHILVARHCLNQFRLSDLHFRIDGSEREMRLVEDGARHGYDYAVLEVVAHSFESFVRLDPVQPPVSGFAVGYAPDDQLILHAEDKPLSCSFFLQEVNYLPTEAGMSGAVYRDMVTGNGFALHIKRCVGGLFEGQNTGILVSELLQSLPMTSALSQLCRGEYGMPSIEMPHPFSCFSTAMADEIDQGGEPGVGQIRKVFQNELDKNQKAHFLTPHMKVGPCVYSSAEITTPNFSNFFKKIDPYSSTTAIPLIIEVMETNRDCAMAKIDALVASGRLTRNPIALIVGLNTRVAKLDNCKKEFDALINDSKTLAAHMQTRGIRGACIPMVWKPVTPDGGYVFPYLEARSILSLHPGIQPIHDQFLDLDTQPVFRWMDSDVSDDPLMRPCRSEADKIREKKLQTALYPIARDANLIGSGGYSWQTTQIKDRLKALKLMGLKRIPPCEDEIANTMIRVVDAINCWEAKVRTQLLTRLGHRGIYWPEPNLYSSFAIRQNGAVSAYEWAKGNSGKSQQQESTYVVSAAAITDGIFDPALATTKPIKDSYADWDTFFERMVPLIRARKADVAIVRSAICDIRQTHLKTGNVAAIHVWHNRDNRRNRFNEAACAEVCETHLFGCADEIIKLLCPKTELPK